MDRRKILFTGNRPITGKHDHADEKWDARGAND